MKKIFIDGRAGTTGLHIEERLRIREDITLLVLPEEERKDVRARGEMLNAADVAFLCLPDGAAREAAALVENPATAVIDASTAHRTAQGWQYGFPELGECFRLGVKHQKRVALPGCHASGFLALVHPLLRAGLLPPDALLHCFSLTGCSGGGKAMIAEYAAERAPNDALAAPRQYALAQAHKHLPEMRQIAGLESPPVFCPIVADYYSGMEVTVPLHAAQLCQGAGPGDILMCYREAYADAALIKVRKPSDAFLSANEFQGKDTMEITVQGNDARILLIARFDNLGKGASGAAVQCLNIALGLDETEGLVL